MTKRTTVSRKPLEAAAKAVSEHHYDTYENCARVCILAFLEEVGAADRYTGGSGNFAVGLDELKRLAGDGQ